MLRIYFERTFKNCLLKTCLLKFLLQQLLTEYYIGLQKIILHISIGIATDYRADSQNSIPGRDRDIFILHSVQTGSGANSASYTMGTWAVSLGVRPVRDADHPPQSNAEVNKGGAIPPLPDTSSRLGG
jgi:hypothetical protein